MFYSHEILTNRQHGVATIWLVATLGAKSSLKKVTRRAILDVDVPKACDAIIEPHAPMALRLQGSLLYGVSRVYSQQSGYLLCDAENLRDKIIGTVVMMKETELDPEAGRARPDQLNLPDDPAFQPDLDMHLDMALFDLLSPTTNSSRLFTLLSPRSRSLQSSRSSIQRRVQEREGEEELQLRFPSADPSMSNQVWDFGGGVGSSSAIRTAHAPLLFGEESVLIEDPDLEVDADGNLVAVLSGAERDDVGSIEAAPRTSMESGTRITDRVRAEHEAEMQGLETGAALAFDDAPMLFGDDPSLPLPPAQPFLPSRAAAAGTQQEQIRSSSSSAAAASPAEASSSSVVEAAQRRARQPKPLLADTRTELTNKELNLWNTNYLTNMQQAIQLKEQNKSLAQAKKNAAHWVIGQGIAGVGRQFAGDSPPHPLAVFSGQTLLDALLRGELAPARSKRSRDSSGEDEEENDEKEEARRVRARIDDEEEQFPRGDDVRVSDLGNDDGIVLREDDVEIEMGRNAPPSLPDRSSQMPWNISASRHGSARPLSGMLPVGIGSSIVPVLGGSQLGPPSALGRRGSRFTSSSPLLGRGRGNQQQRYSSLELPAQQAMGATTEGGDGFDTGGVGFGDDFPMTGSEDFELHGPVDPQATAAAATAQSEYMATTLDDEAYNFLAFLDVQIGGGATADQGEEEEARTPAKITLDTLLPPADNTKAVGAQALLHVLTLATKGLIQVSQEEAFGDIEMSVVAGNVARDGDEEDEEG